MSPGHSMGPRHHSKSSSDIVQLGVNSWRRERKPNGDCLGRVSTMSSKWHVIPQLNKWFIHSKRCPLAQLWRVLAILGANQPHLSLWGHYFWHTKTDWARVEASMIYIDNSAILKHHRSVSLVSDEDHIFTITSAISIYHRLISPLSDSTATFLQNGSFRLFLLRRLSFRPIINRA